MKEGTQMTTSTEWAERLSGHIPSDDVPATPDEVLDALRGMIGLVQLIASAMPEAERQTILTNHRYFTAVEVEALY
jgi:hypothetical protein